MNQLLQWLSEGDLHSDGLSNEIVKIVMQEPDLIDDLIEGLDHSDEVVRGHTSDALEKIGRSRPDLLEGHIPKLLDCIQTDSVAMVKMHLAMIIGHLVVYEERADEFVPALLALIHDESVFAASWAIVSLCIFGRKFPDRRDGILQQIATLQGHESIAVRTKVKKAIRLLTDESVPFPPGWIKSEQPTI